MLIALVVGGTLCDLYKIHVKRKHVVSFKDQEGNNGNSVQASNGSTCGNSTVESKQSKGIIN